MDFKEIKRIVDENSPEGRITKVDVEGPKVIVYTDNMAFFVENNQVVRDLATALKKRIIVRSTSESLMDPEESKKIINEVIPADANIVDVEFDPNFGEVRIEAEKLG